jgi:hypothetical protein
VLVRSYEGSLLLSEGYLSFNKDAVFQDLSQGQTDIFTELATTQHSSWYSDTPSVHWSQADYYRISQAVFESIWNESSNDWNLSEIMFTLDCASAENGPQFGSFTFFKTYQEGDQSIRLERHIDIGPRIEEIYWNETKVFPVRYHFAPIDLSKVKFPVESVLSLAENLGGREIRLSLDNNCMIFLSLISNSRSYKWYVSYSASLSKSFDKTVYDLDIDPMSGEYKINKPK